MVDRSTLVAGETLVDFIPDRPGPIGDVDAFTPRPGGAPANVAVAMTRLDATPDFLTCIGTGPFGDFLARSIERDGIPDRFVQRDPNPAHRTTLAFVTHDGDGDRSFTFYRDNAADEHVSASTIPDTVLAALDRIVVGGVLLTTDPARTEIFDLVDRARTHDCTVVFDPNSRPELWADDADPAAVIERMLERVDVVKTATDDFAWFDYPQAPDRLAERLLELGPHSVLLTLGGDGAALHTAADAPWGAGTWSHPGYGVEVVDTTGAGDAFLGGILAKLDATDAPAATDPTDLLGFANAVAALTTTGDGAWTALPDRETVAEFQTSQRT